MKRAAIYLQKLSANCRMRHFVGFPVMVSNRTELYLENYFVASRKFTSNLLPTDSASTPIHPIIFTVPEDPQYSQATVWFENIFPLPITIWGYHRNPFLRPYSNWFTTEKYKQLVPSQFPDGCVFKIISTEINEKERGMYMTFKYKGGSLEEAFGLIQEHLSNNRINFLKVNAYQVRGRPWIEDLTSRIPSRRLHVEFHGPDLTLETLFKEFRIFGRITDIKLQKSTDKEEPRYASVQYLSKRSATSARNCIHGELVGKTTLAIGYEESHGYYYNFYAWALSNIRLSVFLMVASIGAFSSLVLDPWREFSITNRITGRLRIASYTAGWLDVAKHFFGFTKITGNGVGTSGLHKDQQIQQLRGSLKQAPEAVVVVTGPKGSGKTSFVHSVIGDLPHLIINCEDMIGKGEYNVLASIAAQVNFWPSFSFLQQLSGAVDSLVTATSGVKANLATTSEMELRKILQGVTKALQQITGAQQEKRAIALKRERGTNGEEMKIAIPEIEYPVVVLEDFLTKEIVREQFVYDILAEWAAQLLDSRIANVIVVSGHPKVGQAVSKFFPTKSPETFHLDDASIEESKSFVKARLGADFKMNEKNIADLGGRLHDLELYVSKIQSGMNPNAAFNDIVRRAVAEFRKLAFEDGTNKRWTNIQAWKIVELLAKQPEVMLDKVCTLSLFDNDVGPILDMERAGLISIVLRNERPFAIRAARPIFTNAFRVQIKDTKLGAHYGILTLKKEIASNTKNILEYENELENLSKLTASLSSWMFDPLRKRRAFLVGKLEKASLAVVKADKQLEEYKAMLKL